MFEFALFSLRKPYARPCVSFGSRKKKPRSVMREARKD